MPPRSSGVSGREARRIQNGSEGLGAVGAKVGACYSRSIGSLSTKKFGRVAVRLASSFASFSWMQRVARLSMDASWQTLGMFQNLSKDRQSLRRDVEKDRRDRADSDP